MNSRSRSFWKNALYMALAATLIRTVGVFYNGVLSSHVGAEGMGLYALVMSVQNFALTFATSGVGLAVTRMVSEELARGQDGRAKGALRRATVYALCFSLTATVVLLLFAPIIGRVLLGDGRTVLSLRLLSLSLVPISLCSVMVGYFTAIRRMGGASFIQLTEAGARVLFTLLLLGRLAPLGLEYACAAVVAGAVLAQLVSFLLLGVGYLWHLRRLSGGGDARGLTGQMLSIALPVAFSSYVRAGLLTLEHMLIPVALMLSGVAGRSQAIAAFGVISAMTLPVVMYPMGILASFSPLLVPVVSESRAQGKQEDVRRVVSRALGMALAGGIGCTTVLGVFSGDIGTCLYSSPEAGRYIGLLSWVIPLMFLDHVTDCALKGLGEQVFVMWVNIGDSFISILLVLILLPWLGPSGYLYVILLAEAVNLSFSLCRLCRRVPLVFDLWGSLARPCLAAVVAMAVTRGAFDLGGGRASLVWLLAQMLFMLCLYVGSLTLLGSVRRKKGVALTR